MTYNDSANSDIISSSKYRRTSRTDNRTDSRFAHRQRSPSNGSSSSSSSTFRPPSTSISTNNSRKPTTFRDDRALETSDNYSTRRFSKRDDYPPYRDDSSRNYHSSSSSKSSARDHSSSSAAPQLHSDRRTLSSKVSDVSRVPFTMTIRSDDPAASVDRKHRYLRYEKCYSSVSSVRTCYWASRSVVPTAFVNFGSCFRSSPRRSAQRDASETRAERARKFLVYCLCVCTLTADRHAILPNWLLNSNPTLDVTIARERVLAEAPTDPRFDGALFLLSSSR